MFSLCSYEETKILILGGGQLGRMIAESAYKIGLNVAIFDPASPLTPASKISPNVFTGSFNDLEKIKQFAFDYNSSLITIEIEHVDVNVLLSLKKLGFKIRPDPLAVQVIQDKYLQKIKMAETNIPLGDFSLIFKESLQNTISTFGFPLLLKKKTHAYDGKGNTKIENIEQFEKIIYSDHFDSSLFYIEKWVPFIKELAVMVVARKINVHSNISNSSNTMIIFDRNIELLCYPVVETFHTDNICHAVLAPAIVSNNIQNNAWKIAMNAVAALPGDDLVGIFGVELFLLKDDTILLNEIAPRPHNSGHYTQDNCYLNQFEAHLRAISDLPLHISSFSMKSKYACMINILGTGDKTSTSNLLYDTLNLPTASLHWYDKDDPKLNRKIGHFNIIGNCFKDILYQLDKISSFQSITKRIHKSNKNFI